MIMQTTTEWTDVELSWLIILMLTANNNNNNNNCSNS